MKLISSSKLFAFVLATAFTLTACASHPNASTQNSRNAAAAGRPGSIPTRDGRDSVAVAGGPVGGGNGPEYRVPTGSNLPQHDNRRAYTTDAQDPSYTYDQDDIRLQSTNNVGDSLRSVPGVSVGGGR